MLDCQLSLLENAIVRYSVSGNSPKPNGNQHPTITPFEVFKTKDNYLALAMENEQMWQTFCKTIERPDLREIPEYQNNLERTIYRDKLLPEIKKEIEKKTTHEWTQIFENAKLPYSPVNSIGEIMQHPQVKARKMVVETSDNLGGILHVAGNPIKMSSIEDTDKRVPTPEIGEHNYQIFKEMLNFGDEEIDKLKEDGVI